MILRMIVLALALLVGLTGGAALVNVLRNPTTTVVEPIVLTPDEDVSDRQQKGDKKRRDPPRPKRDVPEPGGGAAPVPGLAPVPAGNDDDSDDDGPDDDGRDEDGSDDGESDDD